MSEAKSGTRNEQNVIIVVGGMLLSLRSSLRSSSNLT